MRYLDAAGDEIVAHVLMASGAVVQFDESATFQPPASATLALGSQNHYWETKWLDFGNPQQAKQALYIDALYRLEDSGRLVVEVMRDLDESVVTDEVSLALSSPLKEVPIGGAEGYWFKARLRSETLIPGTRFDLSGMIWRVNDIDQDR
jgi:hypothetical protein